MPLTNKAKVLLAVAFSVTVTGLMVTASLLRRRKRRKQPRTAVRPITNVFAHTDGATSSQQSRPYTRQLTSSPKVAPRQRVPPMRAQSSSSARASKASSISSLSSISTLRSGGGGASGGSGTLTPINTSDIMTVEGMFNLGKEAFERAISYWRTALHVQHQSQTEVDGQIQEPVDSRFLNQLEKLVEAADSLRPEMDDTAHRLSASNLGDISLDISHVSNASWDREFSRSRSIRSDSASDSDSFVSAAELGELSSLASELNFFSDDETSQELYNRALRVVKEGGVQARRLRTEILKCTSDEDFLAKLHCIRQATIVLFQDGSVRDYFSDVGLQLTADLLWHANYDTEGFIKAYDEMMSYVKDPSSWKDIEQELHGRKVKFLSFYDIVLDFFLLDAFDDLANPPSSIQTVTQNRWLSDGVKETALATAVWSVLSAKTRMLQNPNGFLAKMYGISHHMTPALAWGFMGTNEELKKLMMYFKDQVMLFCQDIFSLHRCRYSSIPELSEDIYSLAREYATIINQKMSAVS